MHDASQTSDTLGAAMVSNGGTQDSLMALGRYRATFRDAAGNVYHEEDFDNFVTVLGKMLLLDTVLGPTTTYTLVGPYIGIIGSAGTYTGPTVNDTMTTHSGWTEASTTSAPTYNGTRLNCPFAASANATPAATKATNSTMTFTFTGSGTVNGAFIVTGTGATNVAGTGTTGTMFSSGALATAQPVIAGNTLTLTYMTTLN